MSGLHDKQTIDNLLLMIPIITEMITDGRLKEAEKNLELMRNALHQINSAQGDIDMNKKINKLEV